ncbi:hypothetical protein GCM10010440_74850 [Kitasatospora cinereorecta]
MNVLVGDGTYRLTTGLSFGAADSGSPGHPVVWQAPPGAHPAISGGYRATRWTPVAGTDLVSTKVPAGTRTRQLYINGVDTPGGTDEPRCTGMEAVLLGLDRLPGQ